MSSTLPAPATAGPGLVANTYLEGTYTEFYPNITQDEAGLQKLFKQFSFPGGIPSHAAPETPGSIHEGGELGYSIMHACGAVFDNPDLLACCVVGDGESETGPLATSWHGNKFLDPVRDGAVLPILHLNGYKIANPTVLARMNDEELTQFFTGHHWKPYFVEGHEPEAMHQLMAGTLDAIVKEIRAIQEKARKTRWPKNARRWQRRGPSHLADDRFAQPEGLDLPENGRWKARRGHVARASGAGGRSANEAGAREDPRRLDEKLSARGIV